MSFWRGLATGVLALGAVGCSAVGPGETLGSEGQRIVEGEPASADQAGVLLLRALLEDQSEILCSAALVGPNLIMTAQHCVSHTTDGQFSCTVRGELVDNPTGGGRVGLQLPAASLEFYGGRLPRKAPLAHGQQIISTLATTVCQNDLAFVVLDTALDLPVLPLRLGRPAERHEPAVLVGYGMSGDNQVIDYRTQPCRQKRGLEVAAIGPDSIADGVTTVQPRVLVLDGPSGCVGDSGGPLQAESSGAVLGVYSLQRGDSCLAPAVRHQLVHVPAFQMLIDEAFLAAGGEPVPEPLPATGGAADAGGTAGQPSFAAGGVAGAEDTVPQPKPKAKDAHRTACSLTSAPGGEAETSRVALLLAFAALVVSAARRAGPRREALAPVARLQARA